MRGCSLRTQQRVQKLVPIFLSRAWAFFGLGGVPLVIDNFLSGCLLLGFSLVTFPLRRLVYDINGEFDPGSGRTLAACLTHASRTVKPFGVDQWRTGE